jgi:glycyl-tRNA synthetase beta chain
MAELLLELLSEEIPARMQVRAAEELERLIAAGLKGARLDAERLESYVTPRRLVLVARGLPTRQPDLAEERKGPRVGAPAKAIDGFLRANGLSAIEQAEVRETDRGAFYFVVQTRAGLPAAEALAPLLGRVLDQLSWPKSMRWADGAVRWVRPLHNILAILDGSPLAFTWPLTADGTRSLVANASTRGHRFLAPAPFTVTDFADYRAKLAAAKVMLDHGERRARILAEAKRLATAEGLALRDDPALADEVAGLVEWPVVMLGRIDERFMDIPHEVLTTAMRAHQKYFSLLDDRGRMAPRFALVANMEAADGGAAIVAGNERVLRARLSDAKFFWDQDRKRTLADRLPKLKERVFHARLGSDYERAERLAGLARRIADAIGADGEAAERAARLAKADLTAEMVGEFPELQGIMGRYYARNDGEPAAVADAIADHYAPQGPSDRCPTAPVSVAVALADKIDTLAGFFAIGEKPTGSKDPFALRRAALGVIRIIIENGLRIGLLDLFRAAVAGYGGLTPAEAVPETDLLDFFADRLKVHLKEQGVRHELIAAIFAAGAEDDLVRLLARVDALRDFLDTDDGANLLTAFKRASNIVRIEEQKDGCPYDGEVKEEALSEQEEKTLFHALGTARETIRAAVAKERFHDAMGVLAGLRAPVDAFFDHVQVNCPAPDVRANRLRLLSQIRSALGGVADFSQIEG